MPRGDGTGPRGEGAGTGKGLGKCAGGRGGNRAGASPAERDKRNIPGKQNQQNNNRKK